MASGKALLGSVLGRLLFRSARITEAEELSPRFRQVTWTGPELRGVAWTPDGAARRRWGRSASSSGRAPPLMGRHSRRAHALHCVFEVSDPVASASVLQRLGVEHADCVPREAGYGHLDLLSARLGDALRVLPEADLVLTGRAQALQALRARLRAHGLARPGRSKAYGSAGKVGLD
ncbi:hypothetical protein KRR26_23130 [Corallococcus sp. M34]|uniref:hypothetical protein n=1 Tax=Citreicoccus inhibens TaxID=2849499 RepID=UPI001C21DE22|nr:hypothetical protein [Citreicoccus inhibens]MBU8898508.1 hypothetical protein [Citreicoccus inhibens]